MAIKTIAEESLFLKICIIIIFNYIFEREILFTGSLSRCPQRPGLTQANARNLELNPSLPHGWHGPKYLAITSCLPGD